MSKFPIKSVFQQISEQVFGMTNLQQAKQYIQEFIDSKDIKESDKQLIIKNVGGCNTMVKLQGYICNSLLKYEGMSVK
jgi:hypothetical protein